MLAEQWLREGEGTQAPELCKVAKRPRSPIEGDKPKQHRTSIDFRYAFLSTNRPLKPPKQRMRASATWKSISWDNHEGCVTLAGDAEHPLPPRKSSLFFNATL